MKKVFLVIARLFAAVSFSSVYAALKKDNSLPPMVLALEKVGAPTIVIKMTSNEFFDNGTQDMIAFLNANKIVALLKLHEGYTLAPEGKVIRLPYTVIEVKAEQ